VATRERRPWQGPTTTISGSLPPTALAIDEYTRDQLGSFITKVVRDSANIVDSLYATIKIN